MLSPAPSPANKQRLAAVLAAAFLGWMFDGLEMGIFPLVARPALLQMQATAGTAVSDAYVGDWIAKITAAFLLGAALGGIVFGWLGDKVGRVRALSWSILAYSLFTGACYFAQTPWQLAGMRFIAALGMGGEWALGVALVMEVWPEKFRPFLAGAIGAASNVGFFLIAVIGINFRVTQDSWRWVMLVGAAPALLTFFIRLAVPESEKWQHAQSIAKTPARPLREIFSPGILSHTLLATAFCGVVLIGTWGSVQWLPSWADQLTQGKVPEAKAYTQALTAFGAIVGSIAGAWLSGRLGRRTAYFILCTGALLACGYLYRAVDTYGLHFQIMVFLVGTLSAAFYGWIPLYLPELFPTRMRATGQGFAYNAGRVLAAVGALTTGQLMQQFSGSFAKAGSIITLIYLVGMFTIWFAPETKGKPLPE